MNLTRTELRISVQYITIEKINSTWQLVSTIYKEIHAYRWQKCRKSKRKNGQGLWMGNSQKKKSRGQRGAYYSLIVQCTFEQGKTIHIHWLTLSLTKDIENWDLWATGLENVNGIKGILVVGEFNIQIPNYLESSPVLPLVLEAIHCCMIVGARWWRPFRGLSPAVRNNESKVHRATQDRF